MRFSKHHVIHVIKYIVMRAKTTITTRNDSTSSKTLIQSPEYMTTEISSKLPANDVCQFALENRGFGGVLKSIATYLENSDDRRGLKASLFEGGNARLGLILRY